MHQTYREIWKEYNGDIANFFRTRLPEYADIEDLVQEVFLALYMKMETGEIIVNVRAWLYKTARNVCSNKLDKLKRSPKVVSIDVDEWQEYEPGEECRDLLFPDISEGQMQEWIAAIWERLEENERVFLDEAYFHPHTVQEIAAKWNMKENTVYQRLRRLRIKVERLAAEITDGYDW